jgi:hypothetical protein
VSGLFEVLAWAVVVFIVGLVFFIVMAISAVMLIPIVVVGFILYKFNLHPLLVGAIFAYLFYVVFLNLFELFLLMLIRHPVLSDIKYLTHWQELSYGQLAAAAAKLAIPIPVGAGTPVLASTILSRQLQKAKKLVDVEIKVIRRLREEKLRQALRDLESKQQT